MNEVGTSLTITGLIATVVSILFAIAALYVSHRRRIQPGGHTLVGRATPEPVAGVRPTPSSRRPTTPRVPMAEIAASQAMSPEARQEHTAASMPSTTPLFNRLGGRSGISAPIAPKTEDHEEKYRWE